MKPEEELEVRRQHYLSEDKEYVINATDNEFTMMVGKLKVYRIERKVTDILATCGIEDKVEACKLIEKICWEILGEEIK